MYMRRFLILTTVSIAASIQADPGAIYPKFDLIGIDQKNVVWVEMSQSNYPLYFDDPRENICPEERYRDVTIYEIQFKNWQGAVTKVREFPRIDYQFIEFGKVLPKNCEVTKPNAPPHQDKNYQQYRTNLGVKAVTPLAVSRNSTNDPKEIATFKDSRGNHYKIEIEKPNAESADILVKTPTMTDHKLVHSRIINRYAFGDTDGFRTVVFEHEAFIYLVGNDYSEVRGFRIKIP